jgi:PKD repeat protein
MVIFYEMLSGVIMRKRTKANVLRGYTAVFAIFIVFILTFCPAAALTLIPSYHDVNLLVANDAGARFDDYGNDTYNFFNLIQSPTQGLNALHITTDPINSLNGQITCSNAQSGVFYISDTGGRGWDDDGVLMLAVNGTVPSTFRVHIRASGYRWIPVDKTIYPTYENVTYVTGAVDEYFSPGDFLYGPQIWKPCPAPDYPIFDGQDMAQTTNTFSIMFIDLNAGILGSNTLSSSSFVGQQITDSGAIKIEYNFENLQSFAAFNAYAYCVDSNQGQGIRWTNRLSETLGSSGYSVIGQPSTVTPLPGQTSAPTDPDHDGLYEDLSGNGAAGFSDVVLFFKNIEWISEPENEPESAFDFSGNGDIGFQDVVLLFKEV